MGRFARIITKNPNKPKVKKPVGVQYPVATPQQLAGSTISQTTTDPSKVKLAPGLAFQYDANGKPIGIVRINQGGAGIPQGSAISYSASGQPSLTSAPGSTSTAPPAAPSATSSSAQGPTSFGDSIFNDQYSGIGLGVDRAVTNRNAQDKQYLIAMGYTPGQADEAIKSRNYNIINPNDPKGIDTNIGSLQAGALDWNQVDVSNPYSRAGMLVKSYRGAVQGTNTGMAAGGHGRSGAALTAQQNNSSNFGSGQNQWNQDLQGYQFGSNDARLGFGMGANDSVRQAMQEFILRQKDTPAPVVTNPDTGSQTSVPATGSVILGNQASGDLPSYDQWTRQYAGGDASRYPKLAVGWSVEIKDGKIVRFIPPGGA